MFRGALFLMIGLGLVATARADALARRYGRVEVAPTKTSIYIGSISMTMPTFVRHGSAYAAAYSAKVFPYFFYNERGTLTVDITDAQLAALAAGQPIDFAGHAVNDRGAERRVTGSATPWDARTGALKVRVYVSKRISLTFHTTYRFGD